ncbi:hypothetical protein [Streptomyces sp900105755]|uniref:Uncharacterized protein n=1 Tax=Streptomyces sp. 900105755 TaxID=3154389 RepID=A0ABV1TR76_9ACTN
MSWDDRVSLWLLSLFGVVTLFLLLLPGLLAAFAPVIKAVRDLRDVWRGGSRDDVHNT